MNFSIKEYAGVSIDNHPTPMTCEYPVPVELVEQAAKIARLVFRLRKVIPNGTLGEKEDWLWRHFVKSQEESGHDPIVICLEVMRVSRDCLDIFAEYLERMAVELGLDKEETEESNA
jgi:hypothetical protein